jgi:hypothetical protein
MSAASGVGRYLLGFIVGTSPTAREALAGGVIAFSSAPVFSSGILLAVSAVP